MLAHLRTPFLRIMSNKVLKKSCPNFPLEFGCAATAPRKLVEADRLKPLQ
jgi:hypothetical protein